MAVLTRFPNILDVSPKQATGRYAPWKLQRIVRPVKYQICLPSLSENFREDLDVEAAGRACANIVIALGAISEREVVDSPRQVEAGT